MGCDIHFFVEKQAKNGRWIRAEKLIDNKYYDPESEYEPDRVEMVRESWYSGRNYRLFSVLAGVRTYHWENPLTLGEPKGIPNNMGAELREQYKWEQGDAHSESHFTLEELMAVDWDEPLLEIEGFLTPENFYRYITLGYPDMWVSTEDVERSPDRFKIVSMMDMKPILEEVIKEVGKNEDEEEFLWGLFSKSFGRDEVCPFKTMVSRHQWIGESDFQKTLQLMEIVADEEYGGDKSKIRAVIWFDN